MMKNKSKQREIEKCKDLLKDSTLGNSQRFNLEAYLISLEMKDTK